MRSRYSRHPFYFSGYSMTMFQCKENYFADCCEYWAQKRILPSTHCSLKRHLLNINSFYMRPSQNGKCGMKQDPVLAMGFLRAFTCLCVGFPRASIFVHGILALGASHRAEDSGILTEGVIKEISVHTEVDITLTAGGTENTD